MSNASEARTGERPIEEWAEAKGLMPMWIQVPARTVGGRSTTMAAMNPQYHLFAQVKAWKAWPEGQEVTETDFDSALAEAQASPLR